MTIDTFLYNDLKYTINMGKSPTVVGTSKVENYISVPYIEWLIDFGLMDMDFKNFMEKALVEEPSFILKTKIHPYVELAYNVATDLLTYIYPHEKKFYGDNKLDSDRILEHTFSDPQITYDDQQYTKDNQISLPREVVISHRVLFLEGTLNVVHKANGLFRLQAKFKELFSPTEQTYNIIGATNVSNPGVI